MQTQTSKCCICGEVDYRDFMSFIDNKPHCHLCADKVLDESMDKLIKEVLQ